MINDHLINPYYYWLIDIGLWDTAHIMFSEYQRSLHQWIY